MKRSELEHAIRAAAAIIDQEGVIVIGSQSILGSYTEDELPPVVTGSIEVDIRPIDDDDQESLSNLIDGSIGEMSMFHDTFGYYVQGVGKNTAILPAGWAGRLVTVSNANTAGRIGYCLDAHDLCVAKLIAAREKDQIFVGALVDAGIVQPATIVQRLTMVKGHEAAVLRAQQWIGHSVNAEQVSPAQERPHSPEHVQAAKHQVRALPDQAAPTQFPPGSPSSASIGNRRL